jgi:uncharacterized delta-60 repeat protein
MSEKMHRGRVTIESLEGRVLLSGAGAAHAAAADNLAGRVVHSFGEQDAAVDGAVQPDGTILVLGATARNVSGGHSGHYYVARFLPNGRLDRRFGNRGKVLSNFLDFRFANAIAVSPDGKIVVGGRREADEILGRTPDLALARYNADGSLDTTFGDGGMVTTDPSPGPGRPLPEPGVNPADDLYDLTVLADGSIVAAGATQETLDAFDPQPSGYTVVRYRPDGQVDPTFGTGGHVISDFGAPLSQATRVAVQPDGKLVLAGRAATRPDEPGVIGPVPYEFGFARLNPDGSPDTTFGDAGRIRVQPVPGQSVTSPAMTFGPDGSILAAAISATDVSLAAGRYVSKGDAVLVRLTPGGLPDPAFGGGDGIVLDDYAGQAQVRDVAADADGSAYVCGSVTVTDGAVASHDLLLARYTPTGERDASFGNGGRVAAPPAPPDAPEADGFHAELTPEGKVLVVGFYSSPDAAGPSRFVLARYLDTGTLDPAFGGTKSIPADQRDAPAGSGRVILRHDGTLSVRGTARRDRIKIGLMPQTGGGWSVAAAVNGRTEQFPLDQVRRIVATGGAGDDIITVLSTVKVPARLDGGFGDDAIVGGGGDDVLTGGRGADELVDRNGTNRLYGRDAASPRAGDAGDILDDEV